MECDVLDGRLSTSSSRVAAVQVPILHSDMLLAGHRAIGPIVLHSAMEHYGQRGRLRPTRAKGWPMGAIYGPAWHGP